MYMHIRMPDHKPFPRGAGRHVLQRTLPLFRPYRWKLLLAGFLISMVGVCLASVPLFLKFILDTAIKKEHSFPLVLKIMLVFVLLMGFRMLLWFIGQSFLLIIREKVIFHLRSAVFAKLQELCMRFHQKYNPGFLFDRTIGGASTSVGMFLSMLFNTLVTYLFAMTSAIIICMTLSMQLTIWILLASVGYVWIGRTFGTRIHKLSREFNLELNKFAGVVTDFLRGVRTIKAFAMEQRVISDFDEQLWPLQLRSMNLNKETMLLSFVGEGLGYIVHAAVIISGAYLALHGRIEIGTLVAFTGYQSMLIGNFNMLSSVSGTFGAAMAGLEQMYEILDEKSTVVDRHGTQMPKEIHGEITFEHVNFGYDGKPVICDLSVKIPAGQSVALVGPSGGGKTTLTNLLIRFYDPDGGKILLDGIDIRDLPLNGYRSLFGVVMQDPFLFNDTIYNNLLAVCPDATEEEVRTALDRAHALEFVQGLKGGWHFNVGESGSQLSGGQRQRIAIARCFLTNPRMMILDEATSALDTQSERFVQQALSDIMQGRNVFVIAHRLSTVRNVDRVLVIQQGQIIQDGTYHELSSTPGLFRDLHLADQLEQQAVEEA